MKENMEHEGENIFLETTTVDSRTSETETCGFYFDRNSDLYPQEVRGDVGGTGGRLALLGGGQRVGLHLGLGEEAHLKLCRHLPSTSHLTHELGGEEQRRVRHINGMYQSIFWTNTIH